MSEQQLIEIKQELAAVDLSIEQMADQGDTSMVEYYVEQQTVLTREIKQLEAKLNYESMLS